ncbi:MAG: hypothetical protein C0462_04465 [Alcanivorax sp.]|nr:hypothetical protein [Alcanivorax sp.]
MVPDPNQKHYAHTAARISKFVKTVSDGAENVDEALAENIIRERANTYGSDELISSYAEELSKSISRAVMNTSIITAARNTSAIDVINHILSVFTEEFDRELQAEHQRFSEEQAAHLEARSDATNTMYLAGVCFGLFLLIVFLSIFIKIERNLRHLQPGAPRKDGNVP